MADIPDYMRGFDTADDWGFTPVSKAPESSTQPSIDPSVLDNQTIETAKIKEDVRDIKSMMSEIMQIVAEQDGVTKELTDEDTLTRFKEIEKVILHILYNLSKSEEPYIHWPNRQPIIKAQIDKILSLTRGKTK
jgi:hypothetical protein